MSGAGWGTVLAGGSSDTNSETELLASDVAQYTEEVLPSVPAVHTQSTGWGSIVGVGLEVAAAQAPMHDLEEEDDVVAGLDMSVFTSPGKKRRGRPPTCFQALPAGGAIASASASSSALVGTGYVHPTSVLPVSVVTALSDHVMEKGVLQVPAMKSYVPILQGRHRGISVNANCLQLCLKLAEQAAAPLDDDVCKLNKCFLEDAFCFHHASVESRALQLKMSRHTLQRKLVRLAAGQLLYARVQRLLVEEALSQKLSSCQKLVFVNYVAYDETPMKTRTDDGTCKDALLACGLEIGSGMDSTMRALVDLATHITSDSSNTKILQCRQRFAILVHLPHGLVKLIGETPVPLQIMHQGNASTLKECLSRRLQLLQRADLGNMRVCPTIVKHTQLQELSKSAFKA
eukprot:6492745-Amphidinium_carterae.1